MNRSQIFKNSKLYVIILLIATGVFFYLRSVNRELIYCDEIIYGYNLNATEYYEYWSSPETSLDGKIETISDVIDSQMNHYFFGNGRSIVHGLEQMFTGVIGIDIFYIVNTIVFLLLVYFSFKMLTYHKYKYVLMLLFVLIYLYLFPLSYRLWYSINMGLNYLWPMCFSVILLWYCVMIIDKKHISAVSLVLISILGFVTGWSHEAFSVPLSGALFFYIVLNLKKFDKRLLCMAIPLWVGTAIMVFAPANFARFFGDGGGESKIYAVANAIDNFMHLKLLWIFVVTAIIFRIRNYKFLKACLAENKLIVYALIIGILFGLVANTAPYSFSAIELFSFLLTIKLLMPSIEKLRIKPVYLVLLTVAFCVHQSMIVKGEVIQSKAQRELISKYLESTDGVVNYNVPSTPWYIEPYVTRWKHAGVSVLYGGAIEFAYGEGKPMYALADADYNALAEKNFYNVDNKFAGSAPFYYAGGNAFWAKASDVDSAAVYEFEYEPVSFDYDVPLLLRIKFALLSESYPKREVAQAKLMKTRWGDFYYILYPPVRKPIAINCVDK